MEFLAPGLVMMAIIQNAFANTSSSIVIAKAQGNIVDTLMPPLTAHELTLAINLGGATRGVLVGLLVAAVMGPFTTSTTGGRSSRVLKKARGALMARQAHHERNLEPFVLSLSKGGRSSFPASC